MADAASLSAPRRFASSTNSPLTEIRDPNTFAALVYPPPQADEPLPLLLYLHGAGESGSHLWDIISEGATGTPPVELHFGRALPALAQQFCVVAPQTASGWPAQRVQSSELIRAEKLGKPTGLRPRVAPGKRGQKPTKHMHVILGPHSACSRSCASCWPPRAPCLAASTSAAATSQGTAWAAPGRW